MKKRYFIAIRPWVFLLNIPFAFLLGVSIAYNNAAQNLFKLYPLIIFLSLFIVFLNIYFFRIIELSYEKIRYIGLFTSRDDSFITEGNTLKITRERLGKLKVILYGHDGIHAAFDWKTDEDPDEAPEDITLFRGHVYGGRLTMKRIFSYFGVSREDFKEILSTEGFYKDYENVTVSTLKTDAGFEVDIKINVIVAESDEAIARQLDQ